MPAELQVLLLRTFDLQIFKAVISDLRTVRVNFPCPSLLYESEIPKYVGPEIFTMKLLKAEVRVTKCELCDCPYSLWIRRFEVQNPGSQSSEIAKNRAVNYNHIVKSGARVYADT